MPDAVTLGLGLNVSGYEANMKRASDAQKAFEKQWVGIGKTYGSVTREMAKEQETLFANLDRLTAQQQRGQLERMANFRPEIILQREILGLRQSIDNIEGTTNEKLEMQIQLEAKVLELDKMIAAEAARTAAAKEAAAAVSARDLAGSGSAAKGEAGQVEKALERKLGLNDAFKGLLVGAGIGSVQAIADALVAPFKSSAESAEKIEIYTEKSVTATRALLDLRLTDAAKIKELEAESARELREAAKAPPISAWSKFLAVISLGFGEAGLAARALTNTEEISLQQAKAAASVQERAVEIARLKNAEEAKSAARAERERVDELEGLSTKQKITALHAEAVRLSDLYIEKSNDIVAQEKIRLLLGEREREERQAIRDYQVETNLAAQEQIERARLHLVSLARPLNVVEGTRLEIMKLQSRELVIQSELAPLIKKGIENLTPAERKRFEELVHQVDKLDKQIGQKQALIDKTKALIAGEHQVVAAIEAATTANDAFVASMGQLFDEVDNVSKAWEDFKGSIQSVGRGDKDLSDRELARKKELIEGELANRQAAAQGTYQGAAGFGNYDVLGESLRGSLQQLLGEMNFRSDVRRTVALQGEDAALSRYSGLTEQRLRQLTDKQSTGQALVDGLDKNTTTLQQGLNTIAQQLKAATAVK